jgi:UPF0755 protein
VSRPFRLLAIAVAALAVAAVAAAGALQWWMLRPLALPASPFVFDVRAGASVRSVARDLAAAGVLPAEFPLVALARLAGADRAIKAGNYEIASGITLPMLLDKLTQGDVTETSLTVVEGSTFAALRSTLTATPDVVKTAQDLPDAELMRRIGAPGDRPEGWFFPDTYFYASGSTDVAVFSESGERIAKNTVGEPIDVGTKIVFSEVMCYRCRQTQEQ